MLQVDVIGENTVSTTTEAVILQELPKEFFQHSLNGNISIHNNLILQSNSTQSTAKAEKNYLDLRHHNSDMVRYNK